jgi:hypothetical protein
VLWTDRQVDRYHINDPLTFLLRTALNVIRNDNLFTNLGP